VQADAGTAVVDAAGAMRPSVQQGSMQHQRHRRGKVDAAGLDATARPTGLAAQRAPNALHAGPAAAVWLRGTPGRVDRAGARGPPGRARDGRARGRDPAPVSRRPKPVRQTESNRGLSTATPVDPR
jgi:hypothetical protein